MTDSTPATTAPRYTVTLRHRVRMDHRAYQPICTCGWEGKVTTFEGFAARAGQDHLEGKHGY